MGEIRDYILEHFEKCTQEMEAEIENAQETGEKLEMTPLTRKRMGCMDANHPNDQCPGCEYFAYPEPDYDDVPA